MKPYVKHLSWQTLSSKIYNNSYHVFSHFYLELKPLTLQGKQPHNSLVCSSCTIVTIVKLIRCNDKFEEILSTEMKIKEKFKREKY